MWLWAARAKTVIKSLTEPRGLLQSTEMKVNDAKFFDYLLFQGCLALGFQIFSLTFRRMLNRRHAARAQSPPNDQNGHLLSNEVLFFSCLS